MKVLTEEDVIRTMREEWDKRVATLMETVDVTMHANVDGNENQILSPGLKVIHKDSGIRYTVDSVASRNVVLMTPEGEKFLIDGAELEQGYELD